MTNNPKSSDPVTPTEKDAASQVETEATDVPAADADEAKQAGVGAKDGNGRGNGAAAQRRAANEGPNGKPKGERRGGQGQNGAGKRARKKAEPVQHVVYAPAQASRRKGRHFGILFSFLLWVILPTAGTGWYLYERATDQYASYVGFSVRKEEISSAVEILGGVTGLSGSSSSDTDTLYKFLTSQELVKSVDNALDLEAIWAKADHTLDPVFAYTPGGTIEDLVSYWERMVKVYYDSGSGLLDLRVAAFSPDDAQLVAQQIFAESTNMINRLSDIARNDAIKYSSAELNLAVERLKEAREVVTKFRNTNQLVDPATVVSGQSGLLNTLQQQLAEVYIERDLLVENVPSTDPRLTQLELKIRVIENRIEEERRKLGIGGEGSDASAFANIFGEYERLIVDREFAQESYTAALVGYDAAQAEAQRQSRYLAAHVRPTLAERSDLPDRPMIFGVAFLFIFLSWVVLILIAYSFRDRR